MALSQLTPLFSSQIQACLEDPSLVQFHLNLLSLLWSPLAPNLTAITCLVIYQMPHLSAIHSGTEDLLGAFPRHQQIFNNMVDLVPLIQLSLLRLILCHSLHRQPKAKANNNAFRILQAGKFLQTNHSFKLMQCSISSSSSLFHEVSSNNSSSFFGED